MNTFRSLTFLSILLIGCNQSIDQNSSDKCTCTSVVSDDTTGAVIYKTVRGALLGTRFTSLDELKTVVQIEYKNEAISSDSTGSENHSVSVRHCSNGREVISILEKGTSQGDILKAKSEGAIWGRFALLFGCPYAVMHRKDMEKIYALSRLRPEWFGAGDLAFFEIARSMVKNINTPDLAFRNVRDSTEKGYLNSFNHITAQAFITSCFSEDLADFIADAHEIYRHPELITGNFTEAQIADLEEGPVDNYVDLVNNEWGQELGKQLTEKYGITSETTWTPILLANYLNDLQGYYSWAFQIGFNPYKPEDESVIIFTKKLNAVMNSGMSFGI